MLNDFSTLPSDPAMLLSIVNMKLRDYYGGDLDELCNDLHFTRDVFLAHMAASGWEFNAAAKKFW